MKRYLEWAAAGLLITMLAAAAFYAGVNDQPEQMEIPVAQVFLHAVNAAPEESTVEKFKKERKTERAQELAALEQMYKEGDETVEKYIATLLARTEAETAVEGMLAAAGYVQAVCAVRENAVTVCVQEKLLPQQVQTIVEMCETATEICSENIWVLDESAYIW